MRIRLWHIALFIVALAIFAVARAPAAFFVPQRSGQFTYSSAEGTIWNGVLHAVRLGPYHADTAAWRISLLDVIRGKWIVPVALHGGDTEGDMVLLGNWHGDRRIGIAQLRLAGVPFAGGLLPGETRFHGLDILFEAGKCARAQGRVESDALVQAGQALGWAGPPLAGSATCEGDNARIALTGANEAGERVNVQIVLMGDGAAAWRAFVIAPREDTLTALAAAGFTRSAADGALGYGEETRWLP